jgi:hypothetical protein
MTKDGVNRRCKEGVVVRKSSFALNEIMHKSHKVTMISRTAKYALPVHLLTLLVSVEVTPLVDRP